MLYCYYVQHDIILKEPGYHGDTEKDLLLPPLISFLTYKKPIRTTRFVSKYHFCSKLIIKIAY